MICCSQSLCSQLLFQVHAERTMLKIWSWYSFCRLLFKRHFKLTWLIPFRGLVASNACVQSSKIKATLFLNEYKMIGILYMLPTGIWFYILPTVDLCFMLLFFVSNGPSMCVYMTSLKVYAKWHWKHLQNNSVTIATLTQVRNLICNKIWLLIYQTIFLFAFYTWSQLVERWTSTYRDYKEL